MERRLTLSCEVLYRSATIVAMGLKREKLASLTCCGTRGAHAHLKEIHRAAFVRVINEKSTNWVKRCTYTAMRKTVMATNRLIFNNFDSSEWNVKATFLLSLCVDPNPALSCSTPLSALQPAPSTDPTDHLQASPLSGCSSHCPEFCPRESDRHCQCWYCPWPKSQTTLKRQSIRVKARSVICVGVLCWPANPLSSQNLSIWPVFLTSPSLAKSHYRTSTVWWAQNRKTDTKREENNTHWRGWGDCEWMWDQRDTRKSTLKRQICQLSHTQYRCCESVFDSLPCLQAAQRE